MGYNYIDGFITHSGILSARPFYFWLPNIVITPPAVGWAYCVFSAFFFFMSWAELPESELFHSYERFTLP